ncbi:energy transducer TonB [Qipengyuania sp. YG27]|uniref:Energy transducer TonB n=1 Tax=Qipengyuania mesophila TaxID=2867246 RepID=A0ABS7JUF0_9SPHN|nr:energy transducer TonB [Qipengyuania mesophila]MBX7501183.1 energy transducer TonB [Qipengyuania mesophila]
MSNPPVVLQREGFSLSGRSVLFGVTLLTAVPSTALAAEPEVVEYAPSSDWHLDYAEARCRIVRTFGEGDDETVLYMEQLQPSSTLGWVAAGGLVKALGSRSKFQVQFGPGLAPFEIDTEARYTLGKFGASLHGSNIGNMGPVREAMGVSEDDPPARPMTLGMHALSVEEGKTIEWIEFTRKGRHYRLRTGEMGSVFAAMNACMTNLVEHWGADPESLKARASGPRLLNIQQVAVEVQKTYPSKAERRGESADLKIRVMVDEKGRVSSCHITEITSAENFSDVACDKFTQLAQFEPARNLDGEAVASYYVTTVRYRMY